MCEICDKIISIKKYEKLRNYLFNELNQIVYGKGCFASIKWYTFNKMVFQCFFKKILYQI